MLIGNYYDLVHALAKRRNQLGLSQLALDALIGFQDGYTGKLEKPLKHYGRHATWQTIQEWMQGLRVTLVLAPRSGYDRAKKKMPNDYQQLQLPLFFSPRLAFNKCSVCLASSEKIVPKAKFAHISLSLVRNEKCGSPLVFRIYKRRLKVQGKNRYYARTLRPKRQKEELTFFNPF